MKINKSNTKFPGARCLHIVTNLAHLSKELAIEICNEKLERRQLLTYGLCVHDMDTYTEDDVERLNVRRQNEQLRLYMQYEPDDVHTAEETWTPSPEAWKRAEKEALDKIPERKAGEKKPLHLHIVLSFSCSRKVDEIARWFGIEPCFVESMQGYIFEKDLQHKLMGQMLSPLMSQIERRESRIAKPQLITYDDFESDEALKVFYSKMGTRYYPMEAIRPECYDIPDIKDNPEPPASFNEEIAVKDEDEFSGGVPELPFDTD